MPWNESERFEELCATYFSDILGGRISRRELARSEGVSRHKAGEVFREVLSRPAPAASKSQPQESDRARQAEYLRRLDAVAQEALGRLTHPREGKALPVGYDTPSLPQISGLTPRRDQDLEAILRRALESFDAYEEREELRRNQRVVFGGAGPVGLVFSGDEHFGGAGTNVRRMLEEAQLVNRTPGLWHCRMGDFVNQFILGRMRSIRDSSNFTIKEEWVLARMLVELITPKLIAVVGGNHDYWAKKAAGMDRLEDILPDGILYHEHEVTFDVHVGEAVRTVKMRHQFPGSSQYNPTHAIEKAAKFDKADFDIGVQGHTHTAALVREFFAQGRRKLAVLTNTFKQFDSYAEEIGFPRSDSSSTCSTVIIEPNGDMFGAPTLEWAASYMNLRYSAKAT